MIRPRTLTGLLLIMALPIVAIDVSQRTIGPLPAPYLFEIWIGTLESKYSAPNTETVEKVYSGLDFTRALEPHLTCSGEASAYAVCEGFTGTNNNSVVISPELMYPAVQ